MLTLHIFLFHLSLICCFSYSKPFEQKILTVCIFFVLVPYLGYCCMAQVSTDQRGRLMMTTERLNQSTDRIKESRRTMLETEELGVSILQDRHHQRQSLLHAHTTLCALSQLSTVLCIVVVVF
jgi:hypothetical protein